MLGCCSIAMGGACLERWIVGWDEDILLLRCKGSRVEPPTERRNVHQTLGKWNCLVMASLLILSHLATRICFEVRRLAASNRSHTLLACQRLRPSGLEPAAFARDYFFRILENQNRNLKSIQLLHSITSIERIRDFVLGRCVSI